MSDPNSWTDRGTARASRGGGLRGADDATRPDGASRLPERAQGCPRCRGRLSGCLPRPGQPGQINSPERIDLCDAQDGRMLRSSTFPATTFLRSRSTRWGDDRRRGIPARPQADHRGQRTDHYRSGHGPGCSPVCMGRPGERRERRLRSGRQDHRDRKHGRRASALGCRGSESPTRRTIDRRPKDFARVNRVLAQCRERPASDHRGTIHRSLGCHAAPPLGPSRSIATSMGPGGGLAGVHRAVFSPMAARSP